MNKNLIKRYIYSVTKLLPNKMQKDVDIELNSLISDMLEDRCGENEPTVNDIEAILTELGDPYELSTKYNDDKDNCLIGGYYYTKYKFVLKIVWFFILLSMTVGSVVLLLHESPIWYEWLGTYIGNTIYSMIFSFTFVTGLFAILYKKKVAINNFSLDNLPLIPNKKDIIPKWESITGIGVMIIFVSTLLIYPQLIAMMVVNGEVIPIFDIQVIKKLWYFPIILAGLDIFRDSMKIIEGKHTHKLLITTIITDALSIITAGIWLFDNRVMNKDVFDAVLNIRDTDTEFIIKIICNFSYFFFGVIVAALLVDLVTTIIKTHKYAKVG